jgi:hypothetical protein
MCFNFWYISACKIEAAGCGPELGSHHSSSSQKQTDTPLNEVPDLLSSDVSFCLPSYADSTPMQRAPPEGGFFFDNTIAIL